MMIEKSMVKLLVLLVVFLTTNFNTQAQVGISTITPDASSALDITSIDKGVLIPRLTTVEKLAITNPAHSLLVFDTDENTVSQNIGTEQDPIWDRLTLFNNQSFYMPSINISTEFIGATKNIDLFSEYKNQFKNPMFKSNGAPSEMAHYTNATDLYYYITYYDPSLIKVNSISNQGVLNYTILRKANYDSYVNIVFVVK